MKRAIIVGAMLFFASCGTEPSSDLDVVYDSDDRKDVYKVEDPKLAELARATAILIPNGSIEDPREAKQKQENEFAGRLGAFLRVLNGLEKDAAESDADSEASVDTAADESNQTPAEPESFSWTVTGASIGEEKNLCEDEPFREQPSPGMCSGFLIAPNLVATAGHCLTRGCGSFKVAFNYFYDKPASERDLWKIPNEDVYECEEILGTYVDNTTMLDFGVIRLNRPVEGVTPVKLRSEGKIKAGTPLAVIGYPLGMPGKVIEGGQTEAKATEERYYFIGNLDTYGGNSGSAVFNAETYEVEGILVRGEDDLVMTPDGCYRSNYCRGRRCRGEDVNRIDTLRQFLETRPTEDTPKREVVYAKKSLELVLPDGIKDGVEIAFRVDEDEPLLDASVQLDLLHSRVGQVGLKLIHPEGFVIELGKAQGPSSTYDLKANYEFLHLRGLSAKGLWRLVVGDNIEGGTGYIDAATLNLVLKSDGNVSAEDPAVVDVKLDFPDGVAIPDKGEGELTLTFDKISEKGLVQTLSLATQIEHPYVSDLTILLTAPDGTTFPVFDGGRGSSSDLTFTYGEGGEYVPGLEEAFAGKKAQGKWQVTIVDTGKGDTGRIKNLELKVYLK